jgi:hypothetical protein
VSGSFLRREWGAVTFVLTVLIGLIVVPAALYFEHPGTKAASSVPAASAPASPAPSRSGSPSASP